MNEKRCAICDHQDHQHKESGCKIDTCSCINFEEPKNMERQTMNPEKTSTQKIREQTEQWELNLDSFKKNQPTVLKQESVKSMQESQSDIWDKVEANWSRIDILAEQKEYELVNNEIEKILEKKFGNISAWVRKGHNYSSWGKYDDAIFCYNNALIIDKDSNNLDKRDYELLNFIGITHSNKGDFKIARNFFKKALKINEEYVPALERLGISYRDSDEFDLAIKQFEKILSIQKNNIDALDHLGYCYELIENVDEAIKCFNNSKLIENKDDEDNYADIRLAYCHYKKNDLDHAELLINKEKITKNESSISYQLRGKILRDKKEYDGAILNFEKAITEYPQTLVDWYDLAWTNSENGNHELALEYYKKHLQNNDNFSENGSYAIGYELTMLDRKKEAIDWYKQELVKYPENIDMLTELGFLYTEFSEFKESNKIWDKLSEISPNDKWPSLRKSNNLLKQNKLEESLEVVTKILTEYKEEEEGPSKAVIMNNMAWILFKMKKYEEGMEWVEKSLDIEPKLKDGLDTKARILYAQKKYEEAEKTFQELFEIEENEVTEAAIGDCKRRKGNQIKDDNEIRNSYYHEAIKIYDSVLKKNEKNDYAWYSKGLCYWNLNKLDDARNCIQKAIEIDANYEGYWNELAEIARRMGKIDQAIVYLDKSIEISPSSWAFVEKGINLKDRGEYAKAVSQYDQALKIEYTTNALYLKGNSMWENASRDGDYSFDDALDCFNEVLKIDPEHADALGGKGNTLRMLKKYDDAMTSVNQSIKKNPENFWSYEVKFVIYEDMGNYQDGIKMENIMLEKFPDKEEIILEKMLRFYERIDDEIKVKEYKEKIQKLRDLK